MQLYDSSSTMLLSLIVVLISAIVVTGQDDYCNVMHQSLLFYEANRSGRLPSTNRVSWRGNSALNDSTGSGTTDINGDGNLAGGYYDAGDHVKFGFPMAFSMTTLTWGLIEFEDAIDACGELENYLDTIKWGTDYFIKAHTAPNEYWGQVGNGGIDHSWWGPAELMPLNRPAYKIDASAPGTDLAMETAAALAAASIVFDGRKGYANYSSILLAHAQQLFSFGDTYRGVYSNSIPDAANYYNSYSGYNDEIVWATAWLYKATGQAALFARAKSDYTALQLSSQVNGQSFDWDNKAPGAAALLAQLTNSDPYVSDVKTFLNWWQQPPTGGITYTPGGLAWIREWGSNRYSANSALIAMVMGGSYVSYAKAQIGYMLGDNPMNRSLLCGYGVNPPINPHHGGAHGSTTDDINNPVNNMHILYGALVGGPDQYDGYADNRLDYVKNEVATDYNACFTAAIAGIASFTGATPSSSDDDDSTDSDSDEPITVKPTSAPIPPSAPTTPSVPTADTAVIYDDSLGPGVLDYGWATRDLQATNYTHSSSKYSTSFEPVNYSGLYFRCTSVCVDSDVNAGIEFYVTGGDVSGQVLRAYLVGANSAQVGGLVTFTVTSNWQRVFIDVSSITGLQAYGVIIQAGTGNTQPTVYVDDVSVVA